MIIQLGEIALMRYKYLTLQELQAELLRKDKGQILIKTEYRGKSIAIPIELAGMIGKESGLMEHNQHNSELLLPAANLAIAATTAVHTAPFSTKGYRWILVLITNPIWSTNPTDIVATFSFTLDGTTFYSLLNPNGAVKSQACLTADGVTGCFFIMGDQFGDDLGAFPSHTAALKIRITLTPAGTAESQNVEIIVYGIG